MAKGISENENPNRDHFSGGIRTPERGFQPIAMGSILESLLTDNKVKVYREFNLKEAKCITTTFPRKQNYKESYKQDYGYELVPEEKREKLIISRFVVNATGYESDKTQERSIKLLCKQCPNTTVYLRSLGLLDVSKCPIPENRSYFGLIDRNGGMVSFFNRKIAAVYIPGLSERGECKGKGLEDYHLPKEGQCPDHADEVLEEDQKSILATILEDVKKKYPFLEKAEGVRLLTRTTVNWNEEIYQRQHIRPYWLGEDTRWLAARSTKATLAPLTALQVVAELINHADIEMRPEQEIPREFLKNLLKIGLSDGSNCGGTVNGATLEDFKGFSKLPELFVFRNLMCPTETTMRNYAKDRELPVEIVERAVSLLPASRGGPLINVRPLRLEPQDDTILTKLVRGIRNHRKELTIFGITTLSGLMGGLCRAPWYMTP